MSSNHVRTRTIAVNGWAAAVSIAGALLGAGGCGSGAAPKDVAGKSEPVEVRGSSIAVSPVPLDFGPVNNGATRAVTIKNTGAAVLTVSSVAFCASVATSPEFTLASPPVPIAVAPGASTAVNVTYTVADFSVTDRGCITIVSDDATQPSVDVALSADGITTAQARTCATCHGNRSQFPLPQPPWTMPAPPRAAFGDYTETSTDPRVGAHQEHIRSSIARTNPTGPLSKPIYCNACHLFPPPSDHATDAVSVQFGDLATRGGTLNPQYTVTVDPVTSTATATCSNVYCHGATLGGGSVATPIWNKVDGTQASCGACHGLPPPAPHPQGAAGAPLECGGCHEGYAPTSVNVETHVDGVLNVAGGACTACHGDENRTPAEIAPAPPRDTAGNENSPAVGAHQSHLTGTSLRESPVACTDCHAYPPAQPHPSGAVEMTWSDLAKDRLPNPSFDRASGTCFIYCHGVTLSGGTITEPKWSIVNGTQAACGTCHGLPPLTPHPDNSSCGSCHPGYTSSSVVKATHINALLELNLSCNSCHGDPGRAPAPVTNQDISAAPPVDTVGNSATTSRGVGAHQSHLTGTRLKAIPVPCADCHVVPASTGHSNGTADVALVSGAFSPGTLTCASVSCHGGALSAAAGGTNRTPSWTTVDGTQAACGTCHAAPPVNVSPHFAGMTSCSGCHTGYTPTSVNKATHINGAIDIAPLTCSSCHGTPGRAPAPVTNADISAAPPIDRAGNTATTFRGVGAHQSHLAGTNLTAAPVSCTSCHVVPTSTIHSNGPVDLALVSGTFNPATLTCASVSCHGGALPPAAGGLNRTPSWITVDGTQAACGACHDVPPVNVPPHSAGMAFCDGCHPGYSPTSVNKATHINGAVDASGSCTACHGDPDRTPAAIAPAPPLDTKGNSATTARGVGAHQAHLAGGTNSNGISCSECHTVPADTSHVTATVELTWGPLARTGGVTPSFNSTTLTCSNYCHGANLGSGSNHNPVWTTVNGTQDACGTCHGDSNGRPSSGRHTLEYHRNRPCTNCHAGNAAPDKAIHVNGSIDMNASIQWNPTNRSCNPSCHGSENWGGTSFLPVISASPSSLSFGNVTAGNGSTLTTTIRNAGGGTLDVTSISLCAGTSAEFSLPSTAGFSLAANATRTVSVTYTPTAGGSDSGCISFASNDAARNPLNVTVSGTGVTTTSGPVISATPNPLDFGTVNRYSSRSLTLTVRNTGTATLRVNSVSRCSGTSSEFSVSSSGFSASAGGTRSLSVTYRPTGSGTDTGCISLSNDDPARNPYLVNVSGTGSGWGG